MKYIIFFLLCISTHDCFAQVKPLTSDEKQKLKAAQSIIDSLKKANPALGNSLPDLNSLMHIKLVNAPGGN